MASKEGTHLRLPVLSATCSEKCVRYVAVSLDFFMLSECMVQRPAKLKRVVVDAVDYLEVGGGLA